MYLEDWTAAVWGPYPDLLYRDLFHSDVMFGMSVHFLQYPMAIAPVIRARLNHGGPGPFFFEVGKWHSVRASWLSIPTMAITRQGFSAVILICSEPSRNNMVPHLFADLYGRWP